MKKLYRRRQQVVQIIPYADFAEGEHGIYVGSDGAMRFSPDGRIPSAHAELVDKSHCILIEDGKFPVLRLVSDLFGTGDYGPDEHSSFTRQMKDIALLREALGALMEFDADNPSEVNQLEIGLRVMPASDAKVKALLVLKAIIHTMPVPITPLAGAPLELFEGAPMAVL